MSNTQENDKFLTKERKIYLETWIIIAIYLAIALPIHFYVPAFSWHWFTFGLIFLIIPLGLICSKTFFVNKMNLTAEQQKKFNQALGIGMLKLWLADFVYMTAFNHWLIPTYILGIIVLIIVFNSLVNAFLGKRDNNSFLNFCLAADLIIGIALTIYLIYIIPENTGNLQNIITTIVAAIYGGLLTLVGVAWTIKSEHVKMQEESAKAAKPLFALRQKDSFEVNHTIHGIRCEITISPASIKWYGYFINSNHSSLYILGVEIKETFYPLKSNNTILQNQEFTLVLKREENVNDSNDSVTLLIRDQIGNTHRYNIKYVYDQSLGVKRFNYAKELSELTDK